MVPTKIRAGLCTIIACLSAAAFAATEPPPIGAGIDYLPAPPRARLAVHAAAPAPESFGNESRVSYTIFSPPAAGTVVVLNRFAGRHVALLVPDAWLQPGKLTRAEILNLLDRADFLYEAYKDMAGGEPSGAGLLSVAFVNVGEFGGFGYVGIKGVEISWADWQYQMLESEGDLNGYIVHEMGHNFDIWNAWISYTGAHAWTTLMDPVMTGQLRLYRRAQEELAEMLGRTRFDAYAADPSANWTDCVRFGNCAYDRQALWGGAAIRIAQLHGMRAIRAANHYVRDYAAAQPPPESPEAKDELWMRSLSAGAATDLSCYLRTWKWQLSPALQSFMVQFGTNRHCIDDDGDGVDEFRGDCNDGSASVGPGATETVNGADDDCSGIADDLLVSEAAAGEFPGSFGEARDVPYPVHLRGALSGFSDGDFFRLPIVEEKAVSYRLVATPPFRGWLFFYTATGEWFTYRYVSSGTVTGSVRLSPTSRVAGVEINSESTPGPYDLFFWDPIPRWGSAGIPIVTGGTARLEAITTTPADFEAAPDRIRFWIAGHGFAGSVAYAQLAAMEWSAPADGTYAYRAIPYAGGVPAAGATPLVAFTTAGPPAFRLTADPASPVSYGTPVTFTASFAQNATQRTGTVVFRVDGTAAAERALSDGAASAVLTLPAGAHTVAAEYSGDAHHVPATASTNFTVTRAATSLSASPSAQPALCEPEIAVMATLSSGPSKLSPPPVPLVFRSGSAVIPSRLRPDAEDIYLLRGLSSGTHGISVEFPGSGNYEPSSASFTLTIVPRYSGAIDAGSAVFAGSHENYASVSMPDDAALHWSIANGAIVSGQGTRNVRYSAGSGGQVTLSLSTTWGSCTTSDTRNIPIVPRSTGATMLYLVTPCRAFDSRATTLLAATETREIAIGGSCGIPADAAAVVANVTVVSPSSDGWVALWPRGTAWPGTSTVNYRAGRTRANNGTVPLGSGALMLRNAGADAHVLIDVFGYYK